MLNYKIWYQERVFNLKCSISSDNLVQLSHRVWL